MNFKSKRNYLIAFKLNEHLLNSDYDLDKVIRYSCYPVHVNQWRSQTDQQGQSDKSYNREMCKLPWEPSKDRAAVEKNIF